MPTNYTPQTATVIPSLPYTITQDPQPAPTGTGFDPSCNTGHQDHALWWVYTAQAVDVVLSVLAKSTNGAAAYDPNTDVWIGTLPGLTEYQLYVSGSLASLCFDTQADFPRNVPVTPGTMYYFQITNGNSTNPVGASLSLSITSPTPVTAPVGSPLILNDSAGWPAWVLSAANGALLRPYTLPASEQAAILPSGVMATWEENGVTTVVALDLYDATMTQTHRITSLIVANQDTLGPITTDGTQFYVAVRDNAAHAVIKTVSAAGVIGGTSWTLPANSVHISGMAVSPDGSTLYYVTDVTADAVHSYNLNTNMANADFLAGVAATKYGRDVLVLSTGDVLIMAVPTSTAVANVKRYNAAAMLQQTYPNIQNNQSAPRMTLGLDNPVSFWVMSFPAADVNFVFSSRFQQFKVSDASVLVTFDVPEVEAGTGTFDVPFGPSQSCPMLLLTQQINACTPPTITSVG